MLALPLNLHSALFTASQLALCTVHWLRTCTMHCFSADCTFVSTLLQARCIHAICHVCVDPVRRVILDLMLNFFCRISSFYILRKMSNSMYDSLSPRAIHCALFLQPSSPVAPQLLLNPSTIKEICNAAQKLELGGASSV